MTSALLSTTVASAHHSFAAEWDSKNCRELPPGGPAPRLAGGHADLSGHWFPNGAGQAASDPRVLQKPWKSREQELKP